MRGSVWCGCVDVGLGVGGGVGVWACGCGFFFDVQFLGLRFLGIFVFLKKKFWGFWIFGFFCF